MGQRLSGRQGTIYVTRTDDGSFLACVVEVPGAVARAATRDDAVAAVRGAFRDYLAMLASRGVTTEHWGGLDPERFEVRDSSDRVFPEDFRPLEEHELRDFLHQFEASQAALIALVGGLSTDDIERKPDPSNWSVREALEHVGINVVAFLTRLEKWPKDPFNTLQAVHRMAFQRFTVMDPEDTAIDHVILGRRWSTRRVMRRLLEHEYEHYNQIRGIIAAIGSAERPPE